MLLGDEAVLSEMENGENGDGKGGCWLVVVKCVARLEPRKTRSVRCSVSVASFSGRLCDWWEGRGRGVQVSNFRQPFFPAGSGSGAR